MALVLALGACKKQDPPSPAKPGSSARATLGAVPGGASGLASPTAFELVAGARGATLIWGPAGAARPALLRAELDTQGRRTGSVSVLLDAGARNGEIADLAAAWVADRLATAWVERSGATTRLRAAWATGKSKVLELGAAWRAPPSARGNVVVASRRGAGLVFSRGDEVGCIDPGPHACYAFSFHELAAERVVPTGLSLSVPVPCTDNATTLVVLPDRWHYGVCTVAGQAPVTTMFTITPEPAYAQANPVLEGCEPAGTFAWKNDAWLVAECQGQRRAARIGGSEAPVEYLDLRALRLDCKSGNAALRAAGFELPLDEPRSRLEALLPSAMAPRGSRAVWSGGALLVASSAGTALRVARYACRGDRWEESSVELE